MTLTSNNNLFSNINAHNSEDANLQFLPNIYDTQFTTYENQGPLGIADHIFILFCPKFQHSLESILPIVFIVYIFNAIII